MPEYTKGKWIVINPEYDGMHDIGIDGQNIASTWRTTVDSQEECLANAKLISAAPDMHEALNDIVYQQSGQFNKKSCGHLFYCHCPWDKAEKALAKAGDKIE